jgi:hypothetical protein
MAAAVNYPGGGAESYGTHAAVQAASTAISPQPSPLTNADRFGPWIWFGTPAAFLLLVLVSLVVYGRLWRRRRRGPSIISTARARPGAYLVPVQDSAQRYLISELPCRIGRAPTNDIVLEDPSVSRNHAEIQRHADGSFTITDLDSLNGIFINDKKIRHARLAEGHNVDIGDVTLRFTFHDKGSSEDPTLLMRSET